MQAGLKAGEDSSASWESIVSAWADGQHEVRPEDLDSPYGRQVWDTYHLIGDVLRSEDLAIKPSDLFYARLSKAIDAEPAIVAPHMRRPQVVRLSLSTLALAAAVASIAWVALPYFSTTVQDTTPEPTQVMASADDAGVRDYVDAHRQFAGTTPIRQVSFDATVLK